MPPRWREIPIAESGFSPDLPPQSTGIIADSSNLYPTTSGVATLPIGVLQIPPESSAQQAYGTFSENASDGVFRIIKATKAHIFHAASPYTTWTEFDTAQTYASPGFWSFAMHDNDIYASNSVDVLQKSTAGGEFAPLVASVGTVPKGLFNLIVQPGGLSWAVMVLGLSGSTMQWAVCGVGDDLDWGYNVATLSATGYLAQTAGAISGAIALRNGVMATKYQSLYFGTFAGPPFVWNFSLISQQIGSLAPLSFVVLGDVVAFLGTNDFFLFDGASLYAIPNKLRTWFWANLTPETIAQVQGRYDPVRDCVFWHFCANGATTPTDWIAWKRNTERWTHGKLNAWMVYPTRLLRSTNIYDVGTAYLDTTGALYNYPATAGTDTTATLTTWDIGADDDALIAVTRTKPHWKTRPTGAQSLSSIVKTFPGTAGNAGISVPSQDTQDYFNLIQAARWQTLTYSFAGDAAIDAIGLETEFAGVQ